MSSSTNAMACPTLDELHTDDLYDESKSQSKDVSDIEYISFGGGGGKGICYAGVIRALREVGLLDKVKVWSGSSIGALAIFLATSGADDTYIGELFAKLNEKDIMESLTLGVKRWYNALSYPGNAISLLQHMGFDSGSTLQIFIEKMLVDLGYDRCITLKEYHEKTGKLIIPVVSCINVKGGEVLYMSPYLFPDFSLAHTLRISTIVPFIFSPQIVKDSIVGNRFLLDGGLYDNTPLSMFDVYDKNDKLVAVNRRALNFMLVNQGQISPEYATIKGFKDYLVTLLGSMHNMIEKQRSMQEYFWPRTVLLECCDVLAIPFVVECQQGKKIMNIAYLSTIRYLKQRQERKAEVGFPDEIFIPSYKAKALGYVPPNELEQKIGAYLVNIHKMPSAHFHHNQK